jgi:hypothetical protein
MGILLPASLIAAAARHRMRIGIAMLMLGSALGLQQSVRNCRKRERDVIRHPIVAASISRMYGFVPTNRQYTLARPQNTGQFLRQGRIPDCFLDQSPAFYPTCLTGKTTA